MDIEYSIPDYKFTSLKQYVKIGNSDPACFNKGYFFLLVFLD